MDSLAKLQYTAPWKQGEQNPLVFWVCSYFGFVFWVCSYFGFVLVRLRSERSPRGNAEESYTAILRIVFFLNLYCNKLLALLILNLLTVFKILFEKNSTL